MITLKHFLIKYNLLLAVILLVGLIAFVVFAPFGRDWELILTVVGGIVSFALIAQKYTLEDTKMFMSLFQSFNCRYDNLNEDLNRIIKGHGKLTQKEINTLYDYFNLCAEEYLMYRRGFIYPEVWESWRKGMDIFITNERVRMLWEEEKRTESYYGVGSGL